MNIIKEKQSILLIRSKKNIIVFIILIIMLVGIISTSIFVGTKLTTPKRQCIEYSPNKYGLNYEEINFKSMYDNINLNGWWIPAQKNKKNIISDKTVIFSHGYGNNRGMYKISAINFAKRLTQEGFNVLMFDFRASGKSEGKMVSIGYYEKYDLLSAIEFAKTQKGSKTIDLMGWSMGATTAILAGVESKDVNLIVADSPFRNLKDYLKDNLSYWSHLPSFPFTNVILAILPTVKGVDINKVNPMNAVKNLKDKHIFLIHSKDDKAIPYINSKEIYNSVLNKDLIKIWITEKAEHIKSYSVYKKEYENKILDFLNNK